MRRWRSGLVRFAKQRQLGADIKTRKLKRRRARIVDRSPPLHKHLRTEAALSAVRLCAHDAWIEQALFDKEDLDGIRAEAFEDPSLQNSPV
jgi:hypothetical protein